MKRILLLLLPYLVLASSIPYREYIPFALMDEVIPVLEDSLEGAQDEEQRKSIARLILKVKFKIDVSQPIQRGDHRAGMSMSPTSSTSSGGAPASRPSNVARAESSSLSEPTQEAKAISTNTSTSTSTSLRRAPTSSIPYLEYIPAVVLPYATAALEYSLNRVEDEDRRKDIVRDILRGFQIFIPEPIKIRSAASNKSPTSATSPQRVPTQSSSSARVVNQVGSPCLSVEKIVVNLRSSPDFSRLLDDNEDSNSFDPDAVLDGILSHVLRNDANLTSSLSLPSPSQARSSQASEISPRSDNDRILHMQMAPATFEANPFLGDTAEFERFIAASDCMNRANFFLADPAIVQVIPSDRLFKIMQKAVQASRKDVFELVYQYFARLDRNNACYGALLNQITLVSGNSEFLTILLQRADGKLIYDIGTRIHRSHVSVQQAYVDACGKKIPKYVGRKLSGDVRVAGHILEYWNSPSERHGMFTLEVLNPFSRRSSTEVFESYDDEDVQIVCMFSAEGPKVDFSRLKHVHNLKSRCKGLSKQSEIQRRFSAIHLDKKARKITLMKSPNHFGPAFVVLNPVQGSSKYELHPEIGNEMFKPFNDFSVLQNPQCDFGLRMASFDLVPGSLVVGLPQALCFKSTPNLLSLITQAFSKATDLADSEDVMKLLRSTLELSSVHERTTLLLSILS